MEPGVTKKCTVCSKEVRMDQPHVVSDCLHAIHAGCTRGWSAPPCAACQSEPVERGPYNVDRGTDPQLTRFLRGITGHVMRTAAVVPPKAYFKHARGTEWAMVERCLSMKAPLPSSVDVLSSGVTFDMLRSEGCSLSNLVQMGLNEIELIQLGYSMEYVQKGDTLPDGNKLLVGGGRSGGAGGGSVAAPNMSGTGGFASVARRDLNF